MTKEQMLKDIVRKVNTFNVLYKTDLVLRSLQDIENEKTEICCKAIAYTQQEVIDECTLTLHNGSAKWGADRLKRFHDDLQQMHEEYMHLSFTDTEDREYSEAKFEEAMRQAWGKYYEPREERYSILR